MWLLIVVVMTGYGEPDATTVSQIGPFATEAACEAAAGQVRRIKPIRHVCVATGAS